MALELFKFTVQATLVERDENGEVIGEKLTDPVCLYSTEKLAEWAAAFPELLADAEVQS